MRIFTRPENQRTGSFRGEVAPAGGQSRRWRATLLVCAGLLAACSGRSTDGALLALSSPPAPLTVGQEDSPRLDEVAPASPSEQAGELEELLVKQAERTEARVAEASFWHDGAVVRWNEIALGMVARYNTSPPNASRVYALLSVAQHDALVGAADHDRTHRRVAPSVADPRIVPLFAAEKDGLSLVGHAAVAAASAAVLEFLYSSKSETELLRKKAKEHQESRLWAGAGYRSDIASGERIGRRVAARVIEIGKNDNSKPILPWPGIVPTGKGMWFSSELPVVAPLRPSWGQSRPWLMTSGSQFRPEPPPDIDSPEFAAALDELRQLSRTRTPEQLGIARRWADGAGTFTPPGHWNQIASELIRKSSMSEIAAARVLAFLNMAEMDAGIACWDAKFTFWLIRPSQVDPTISTPVGLPNFPAYPSGHSTFSGAAAEVLGHFFPQERERLAEMAEEASMSRLYGGIHYRFDAEAGLAMGRAVGKLAIEKEIRGRAGD